VNDEMRRSRAAWTLLDAAGTAVRRGESEAVIDDGGINVGEVGLSFLDADSLHVTDRRIELDLWPQGRLLLEGLGRRHDSFLAELRRARNGARVAGLLAHAPAQPDVFEGAEQSDGMSVAVELQVYPTHLTVVPAGADPWQLPFGAIRTIEMRDDPPVVTLAGAGIARTFGQLARRRDAFFGCLKAARNAQAQLLERLTGHREFSDGLGVPRDRLPGFDSLLAQFSSSERLEGALGLVSRAAGGQPHLGFVRILDPDADSLPARRPLPDDWASFVLVPVGGLVALEILAGPSAATYVFAGALDEVNRDLQALHFRRAALALGDEEAAITPDNPHRLALRRLAPLQRLRAATRHRLVHNAGWAGALARAIEG
jgi:hypothetical protein